MRHVISKFILHASVAVCLAGGMSCQLELINPAQSPASIPLTESVALIAAGGNHACALLPKGLACWGNNTNGQIGNGSNADPVLTPSWTISLAGNSTSITSLVTHQNNTYVIENGALLAWGLNAHGEIGNGSTTDVLAPVIPNGMGAGVTVVATGAGNTSALAVQNGQTYAWGQNQLGQLGLGSVTGNVLTPTLVTGMPAGVTSISVGGHCGCAVASGAVYCWGDNSSGCLGTGNFTTHDSPTAVPALSSGVTQVSTGYNYSCALTASGAIYCWGLNGAGQVGNGNNANQNSPVQVISSGATAITTGYTTPCAIVNGGVQCWGLNTYGQVGDTTTTNRNLPTWVTGLGPGSGVSTLSAGNNHVCAGLNGTYLCWGINAHAQLGLGNQVSPQLIPISPDFSQLQ